MGEMDSTLDILASDVSAFRVEKMHDVVDRLGLKNVRLECIDALSPQQSKFDRILLDVPCSNMGVMPRRTESKYRITQDSMKELAELQYGILESASNHLAKGGVLVYATCSPDPLETTQVVNRFLKAHPEFVKRGKHVLPGAQDNRFDGFFAQALERKKV
jgi:16S rRNA (cytosine967-C5)-methyltransferase